VSDSGHDHEILTFVVRLWREADATGHVHWHGRVERVGTSEVGYVEDVAGVSRLIERWTWPAGEVPQVGR